VNSKLQNWLLGFFIFLTLIPSWLSAYVSENSRQGFEPVFSASRQETTRANHELQPVFEASPAKLASNPLLTLKDGIGSTIALANRGGHAVARIGYDAFGNFRWPDKPGHGVKPCDEKDLPDWLDRLDLGRSFGFDFDGHHWGRHFGKVLTPYLYVGRRYDAFSQQYFNRNRYYQPKYGRFTSSDPIGFFGGNNLYAYVDNNPLIYRDPLGLYDIGGPQFPKEGWSGPWDRLSPAEKLIIGLDLVAVADSLILLTVPVAAPEAASNLCQTIAARNAAKVAAEAALKAAAKNAAKKAAVAKAAEKEAWDLLVRLIKAAETQEQSKRARYIGDAIRWWLSRP
jgi:RHS repeat-associated protein